MKSARKIYFAIWMGVLLLAFGLAVYARIARVGVPSNTLPPTAVQPTPTTDPQTTDRDTAALDPKPEMVKVAFPDWESGQLKFRIEERPVPANTGPLKAALDYLVEEAPQFPQGTKVNSVSLKNGLAVIDFSPELTGGMGSDEEAAVIQSLQKTCGQFENVKHVRVLVEGKPIETLGHSEDVANEMAVLH